MKKLIYTALLLINLSSVTYAATFCVTTVSELRSALDMAESNNQHDEIRIEMGDYETAGTTFSYTESQGFDLEISGGWVNFFGNPCGVQGPAAFLDTALDANGVGRVMSIGLHGFASLRVSRLSFLNGNTTQGRGGGLFVYKTNNLNTGDITIEQNAFVSNQAVWGSAMSVSGADRIDVRNNLIVNNVADNRNAVEIVQGESYGIFFNNNTVIGNFSSSMDASGVYLANGTGAQILVANNVLRQNMVQDLRISGASGGVYVFNNNLGVTQIPPADIESNNFSLPARFEPVEPFYAPASDSPLIDAGANPCGFICPFPTPFWNNWHLGDTDLVGQARAQGDVVDVGAFESSYLRDLIYWSLFE